jgi:hypothetical protein
MLKPYKTFLIIFIVIMSVLLFFLKKYNDIIQQDQIDILVSKNIEIINDEITYQKKHALSLAILFSKNHNIMKALQNNDRVQMKQEINSLLSNINTYTDMKNIQVQVHTKNLEVFFRSWEEKDIGMSLKEFRKGLVKVQKTQEPFVSNELGKRLNIKAIAPIFDTKEHYIGSLEVIISYSDLQKKLHAFGIEIIPLLDIKYLHIAKYHAQNTKLYDYALIINQYDQKLFDLLKDDKSLLDTSKFYSMHNNLIITMIPIHDMYGSTVGYIVASFQKNTQYFNYLPQYHYDGYIISNHENFDIVKKEKPEIIIK